jgi:hypothetical protein
MLHPNLIKNHRHFVRFEFVSRCFCGTKFKQRWVSGMGCVCMCMCMHVVCTGSDAFAACR